MAKRAAPDPRQLALSFDAPAPIAPTAGVLAGLDRWVAGLVSRILREDDRSHEEVAAAMASMLGERVSPQMLRAYAAEAKETHNISAARFVALVMATRRADALDALAQRVGCRVLEGEEYQLARLGHVQAEIARLKKVERDIKAKAQPFAERRA